LQELRERCEEACNTKFNAVLVNLYRNGQDSMGWHGDDEPELGKEPTIASLNFGEVRRFEFRHNISKQKVRIVLAPGSLLVMSTSPMAAGVRINLTFRLINKAKI
jgi:alkylated DNA repair dioxygenase AlkB